MRIGPAPYPPLYTFRCTSGEPNRQTPGAAVSGRESRRSAKLPWVEIFVLFLVSHLVGDFLLQTEWQAVNKSGGLSSDPVARRALLSHGLTYTLSFVPALIWLSSDLGVGVILVAFLIGLPHIAQDDGRAVRRWMVGVKHADNAPIGLTVAVDQSFHMVVLLLTAIICGS
jgi:fatty acid desaturase